MPDTTRTALTPAGASLCGMLIERAGATYSLAWFSAVFVALATAALWSRTIRDEPSLAGR